MLGRIRIVSRKAVMNPRIEIVQNDVLVVGGGLAGHRAALSARAAGSSVSLVFRSRGASPFVSGFNVPLGHADARDTPSVFFDDMVKGGYGLNDRRLVRALTENAVAAFDELVAEGVEFASTGTMGGDGRPTMIQRHLSGNTYPRSVYIREGTGRMILKRLTAALRQPGIEVFSGQRIISLVRADDAIVGALGWNPKTLQLTAFGAKSVVMAMGGVGRLYADSTYPIDVSADALGLALEAGANLIDMEFIQFEPVVTMWPEECRGMEMPTAMLGDGVHLKNAHGHRFMLDYNPPLGEKGIEKAKMALFVQKEIDEGRAFPEGGVMFDTTVLSRECLQSYATHYSRLRAAGVDPAVTAPIVAPAAHSLMGGVFIDDSGWSGVEGLFVCGEAAGGLHGASRIAGNGSTDTIVFGGIAGRAAAERARDASTPAPALLRDRAAARIAAAADAGPKADSESAKARIGQILSTHAGIWRSERSLTAGLAELDEMRKSVVGDGGGTMGDSVASDEARRMRIVAEVVLRSALARKESRGAHQRSDFPNIGDEHWLRHVAFSLAPDGTLASQFIPIH